MRKVQSYQLGVEEVREGVDKVGQKLVYSYLHGK